RAVSSRRKASRPPAEAPRPTTGKLSCPSGERRLGDKRRAGGERAAPDFCGPFSIICQFYHNTRHRRDNGVTRQCPRPVEDGAVLSRRFDHSLQLSGPCGVVDGPSAYLTRGRQIHRREPHRNAADCTNLYSKVAADQQKHKQTNLREG